MELQTPAQLTPATIMEVGMGYWASKTLLSAVEIGVFTELAKAPQGLETLQERLGLHARAARDFLDALVALGFLERRTGIYSNTPETDLFLDKQKSSYIGGILEMSNSRLYGFWNHLTEALRTGEPQNEAKGLDNESAFASLYTDPAKLKEFLIAMTGISRGSNQAIAQQFAWQDYQSFVDVGTAQGDLAVQIASAHVHLSGLGFDLPAVEPIFTDYAMQNEVSQRLQFVRGDFFQDPLPSADVILFGHILHDWSLSEKRLLLQKAYDALPRGGAVIVYEAIIDDNRSQNAFGLLLSLNMLVETRGGFDFTGADCTTWMKDVGFNNTRVEPLTGPDSMVIGFK